LKQDFAGTMVFRRVLTLDLFGEGGMFEVADVKCPLEDLAVIQMFVFFDNGRDSTPAKRYTQATARLLTVVCISKLPSMRSAGVRRSPHCRRLTN
jgi:hypothetical protein